MKQNRLYNCTMLVLVWFILVAIIIPFSSRASDKMAPEEIIAKHLDSIAAAETRASVHSRIAAGTVVATMHSPGTAKFTGQAVIASDGIKNMIGMGFEGGGKFQERFAFDGKEVSVGFARPGDRGYLGDFLLTHQNIVREGLIGGTLSAAWPLLSLTEKKQKLEFRGTKKMANKNLYEIKYVPHGASDLEISIFFDSESFQHVRTEYTRFISAGMGGAVDASGSQRPTRYKMVEEFSDFRKESGLMLPHNYKIGLEFDTRGGTLVVDWEVKLSDFAFNQAIPPATFNVNPKP